MKKLLAILIFFTAFGTCSAIDYKIPAFGREIVITFPENSEWAEAEKQSQFDKGIVMFYSKNHPYTDPNLINPSIGIVYERIPPEIDSLDKYVEYSEKSYSLPVLKERKLNDRVIQICKWKNKFVNYSVRTFIYFEGFGVQINETATDNLYDNYKHQLITFAENIRVEDNYHKSNIRHFDIATIETLGRRIYEQDSYAAKATDALFARKVDMRNENIRGWIVVNEGNQVIARFIKEENNMPLVAYDVLFGSLTDNGVLIKPSSPIPSDDQVSQYKARQTAIANIPEIAAENYNTVVLPDVNSKGFLVYILAATTNTNEIILCGHYRFSIASDGKTIEQIDKLYKSFLSVPDKRRSILRRDKPESLFVTHLVSDTPVETEVFTSLLYETPIYVSTSKTDLWKIEQGKIAKVLSK